MEQRPLRLGDILDDYCPRERRLTNHAIVAMIGDDIKQTRCTTCDAEHVYKGGRSPRRKKKDGESALYREVLAGMPDAHIAVASGVSAPAPVPPAAPSPPELEIAEPARLAARVEAPLAPHDEHADEHADDEEREAPHIDDVPRVEEGPVHRRLIRATLPRPEGAVKEPRAIPEFTIHRNGGRGGQFRGGQQRGNGAGAGYGGSGNGHGQGRRFAGGGNGSGSGFPGRGGQGSQRSGGGFRGGQGPARPGGGGKKRSR
jgi:hypothetical protein